MSNIDVNAVIEEELSNVAMPQGLSSILLKTILKEVLIVVLMRLAEALIGTHTEPVEEPTDDKSPEEAVDEEDDDTEIPM